MSNIKRHPDCRMRATNGNCNPIGGFCTSNSRELCEAMQNAYRIGMEHAIIEVLCRGADMRGNEYQRHIEDLEHSMRYEPTFNPEDGSM